MKTIVLTFAITTSLFVVGAFAQHEEHQAESSAAQADTSQSGMMGRMPQMPGMSSQMMMPEMMTKQQETAKLVQQLLDSLTAIRAEKNSAALKAKLDAHEALLKELQAKVQSSSNMMEMMHHMMGGQMMNSPDAPKN